MSRRVGQTSLTDAVLGYLRRKDRSGGLARARVIDAWPVAAGPEIARHTAGTYMREDELVVYVDSPVWATELSALSAALLKRLNEVIGQELVRSIRFTVSKRVQEQKTRESQEAEDDLFYAEDKVDPVPLSDTEIEQVRRSAEAIRSPELRETVIRATIKDLEWKRGLEHRGRKQGI